MFSETIQTVFLISSELSLCPQGRPFYGFSAASACLTLHAWHIQTHFLLYCTHLHVIPSTQKKTNLDVDFHTDSICFQVLAHKHTHSVTLV